MSSNPARILSMRRTFCFFKGIVVDHMQSVKFAIDVAKGMVYLHSMEPLIPRLYLTSYHVMVSFSFPNGQTLS